MSGGKDVARKWLNRNMYMGRDNFEYLVLESRMILKWNLKEEDGNLWTG